MSNPLNKDKELDKDVNTDVNKDLDKDVNKDLDKDLDKELPKPTEAELALRAKIEAEIKADNQKEIDRRVSDAVKKREIKLNAENAEKERLAKLSEEERIKELQDKAVQEQKDRELLLNSRELKLELIDYLTENNIDLSVRELINIDIIAELEDKELRGQSLKNTVDKTMTIFNNAVDKKVAALKEELLKGKTPAGTNETTPISDYDKASKLGDVKNMLLAKFN